MRKISLETFRGWRDCVVLQNSTMRLVVTTQVGPRVIFCGAPGGENIFHVDDALAGTTDHPAWVNYGGHRLRHSPQEGDRPNQPDNDAVAYVLLEDGARFTQSTEPGTGMQKELEVHLDPQKPLATVVHRIRNRTVWDVTLAPWALSVMRAGGTAYVPVATADTHYLPNAMICYWPYTRLVDTRFSMASDLFSFRQVPGKDEWFKLGMRNLCGRAAYWNNGTLFLKTVSFDAAGVYPDFGANCEVYIDGGILELETLGPLVTLRPGACAVHTETWQLLCNAADPAAAPGREALLRLLRQTTA